MSSLVLQDNHGTGVIQLRIVASRSADAATRRTSRSIRRPHEREHTPPWLPLSLSWNSLLVLLRLSVSFSYPDWNSDKDSGGRGWRTQPLPLLDHCLRTVNSPLGTPTRPLEVWSLSWKRKSSSISILRRCSLLSLSRYASFPSFHLSWCL